MIMSLVEYAAKKCYSFISQEESQFKKIVILVISMLMTAKYLIADDDYSCDVNKYRPIHGLPRDEFKCEDPGKLPLNYIFK